MGDGRTRHDWTEDDDIGLYVAIDDVSALMEHYDRQGYSKSAWWDSVAGRLHHLREGKVRVTGSACRARWQRLEAANAPEMISESDAVSVAWNQAAKIVSKWESEARSEIEKCVHSAYWVAVELGDHYCVGVLDAALKAVRRGSE